MKLKHKALIAAIIVIVVLCAVIADYLIYYMKAAAQRPLPQTVDIWKYQAPTGDPPAIPIVQITNQSPEFAKIAAYAASADARKGLPDIVSHVPVVCLETEDLKLNFGNDFVIAQARKPNCDDWFQVRRTKTTKDAEIEAMIRKTLDAAAKSNSE